MEVFLGIAITVIVVVALLLWVLGRRSHGSFDETTARRAAAEAERNRDNWNP